MDIKLIIRAIGADAVVGRELPEPSQVEVREQLGEVSTFTLTFSVDVCENEFQLLKSQYLNPLKGIGIFIKVEEREICLIKGIITSHQITLKHGGEGSQLKVTGSDNSARLGWVKEIKNWKKQVSREEIVLMLTSIKKDKKAESKASYPFKKFQVLDHEFGIEDIEKDKKEKKASPVVLSFEKEQVQNEPDLAFIKRLAKEKGCYFWIDYDDAGEEVANFNKVPSEGFIKPIPKDNAKDEAAKDNPGKITLNLSGENNDLDEFSISWNIERPTSVKSVHTDRKTRETKKLEEREASQPKLGEITLKEITDDSISDFLSPTVFDESDSKERNSAALDEAEWFIKASCSTTYERLCKNAAARAGSNGPTSPMVKIIHAHTVVNILGTGSRYDGDYLVAGVTHSIDGADYKMQIELKRNGWNRTEEDIKIEGTQDEEDFKQKQNG